MITQESLNHASRSEIEGWCTRYPWLWAVTGGWNPGYDIIEQAFLRPDELADFVVEDSIETGRSWHVLYVWQQEGDSRLQMERLTARMGWREYERAKLGGRPLDLAFARISDLRALVHLRMDDKRCRRYVIYEPPAGMDWPDVIRAARRIRLAARRAK